jgi:hypothetical protein
MFTKIKLLEQLDLSSEFSFKLKIQTLAIKENFAVFLSPDGELFKIGQISESKTLGTTFIKS